MKLYNKTQYFTSLVLFAAIACQAVIAQAGTSAVTPTLKEAWKLEGIDTPESVLEVHKGRESYFLVSAIEGDFFTKDGIGSILKISADGEILQRDWVSGLNAPKGLAISHGNLYVADIDELVVIDLDSGAIKEKIAVPDAVFLNDVAADKHGSVYVSDTFTGTVYRLTLGKVEVYLTGVNGANGLLVSKNNLLVGAASELLVFDKSKQSTLLAGEFPHDIDGITQWGCGSYFVSAWDGLVYAVSKNGEKTLLLDSVDQEIKTADLTYSKRYNLLLVPNFFSNTITAYKVQGKDHH